MLTRIQKNIKPGQKRSFTLTELVIVMAVLAILGVLVTVSLFRVMRKTRDVKRLADMKTIASALEVFYDDHGRYPNLADDGVSDGGLVVGMGLAIDIALAPYIEGVVPADPMTDRTHPVSVGFYYAYDPIHEVDYCTGTTTDFAPVLGFNRAESNSILLQKDTCNGGNMGLNNADYNIAFVQP